jgi:hypothetical protein
MPESRLRRQTLAGVIMLLQALIFLVGALVIVATPHSVCHVAASGIRRCGQRGETNVAWVAGGAIVLLVVSSALLADARWAPRAGLALSALLATAGVAVVAVTFASASHSDRSTYGALWIVGLVVVAVFAAPVPLLWPGAAGSQPPG